MPLARSSPSSRMWNTWRRARRAASASSASFRPSRATSSSKTSDGAYVVPCPLTCHSSPSAPLLLVVRSQATQHPNNGQRPASAGEGPVKLTKRKKTGSSGWGKCAILWGLSDAHAPSACLNYWRSTADADADTAHLLRNTLQFSRFVSLRSLSLSLSPASTSPTRFPLCTCVCLCVCVWVRVCALRTLLLVSIEFVSCTVRPLVLHFCNSCGLASCLQFYNYDIALIDAVMPRALACVLRSPQCIIVFVSSPPLWTPPPPLLLVVSRSIIRISTARVALTIVQMHVYDSTRPPTLAATLSTLLIAHAPSSAFYIFVHVLYYLLIITTQNNNLFIS